MRQIISNLISNAVKYSSAERPVQLTLQYVDTAWELAIRDHGIGIPEADLSHLFEPFHRSSNVGTISGTGLGLVIVKDSVELHGGTVSVESQLGAGTTVTVRIPTLASGETKNDEDSRH
jgi:chemotaxis family two-component system sensor kinase Cph1